MSIAAISSLPNFPQREETPLLLENTGQTTAALAQKIIAAKEQNVEKALSNKWVVYDPVLIGGDFFTTAYLGLEGVISVFTTPGLAMAASVCGIVGGLINIGVAFSCLREAIPALKAGDTLLGGRLLCDFIFCLAIGVVMILASIAQFGVLAGVGAFFAANPWLLPVLFFVITIPIIYEVSKRVFAIKTGADIASQIHLPQLKTHLQNLAQIPPEAQMRKWNEIFTEFASPQHPFYLSGAPSPSEMNQKMERFQAGMGVKAALSAHKLMLSLLQMNSQEALKQLPELEKEIAEWNFAQNVRLTQQILYIFSFALSMIALPLKSIGAVLNSIDNGFMAGANGIPLYMDTFWPFKRNTPIVVAPAILTKP